MKQLILALTLSFSALSAAGAAIEVGQPLPPVTVRERGELFISGDDIVYKTWKSDRLRGRMHVFQYMAARMSTREVNEPFTDAIDAADFPTDQLLVTTVVNLDDALPFTNGLINSELKKNKRKYPNASLIADEHGIGQQTWGLVRKTSAIAVIGRDGKVLFFKEGSLTPAEIKANLKLISANIPKSAR